MRALQLAHGLEHCMITAYGMLAHRTNIIYEHIVSHTLHNKERRGSRIKTGCNSILKIHFVGKTLHPVICNFLSHPPLYLKNTKTRVNSHVTLQSAHIWSMEIASN